MAAIDDTVQRLQAAAKAQDDAFTAATAPLAPAHLRLSMSIPLGTAVLDLVTGLKGIVVNGKRENVILPPAQNAGG